MAEIVLTGLYIGLESAGFFVVVGSFVGTLGLLVVTFVGFDVVGLLVGFFVGGFLVVDVFVGGFVGFFVVVGFGFTVVGFGFTVVIVVVGVLTGAFVVLSRLLCSTSVQFDFAVVVFSAVVVGTVVDVTSLLS